MDYEQLKSWLAKPHKDPVTIVNADLISSYLQSKDSRKIMEEKQALELAQSFSILGMSKFKDLNWVIVMINEVSQGRFYRRTLDENVIQIFKHLAVVSRELYFICEKMTTKDILAYYRQNAGYVLGQFIKLHKEKDYEQMYIIGNCLFEFFIKLVATKTLNAYAYENYAKIIDWIFMFYEHRWRYAFDTRIKFGELKDFSDRTYKVPYEDLDDINMFFPYIGFKIQEAYIKGTLSEYREFILKYFEDRGKLDFETKTRLLSMADAYNTSRYNHTLFFVQSVYNYLFRLPVVVPVPPQSRAGVASKAVYLQNYLKDDNLIDIYIKGYLGAYIPKQLSIFQSLKEEYFDTLKLNTYILYNHEIITRDQAKDFIEKGRVIYHGKT